MKTKLHSYHFNISNPAEREAYNLLRLTMAKQSRHTSPKEFLEMRPSGSGFEHLLLLSSPTHNHSVYEVELDPKHLFSSDQWNTVERGGHSGYRVFDWVEYISPHSRSIKRGHWLEVTDEMVDALQKTMACGYCGAMYGNIHPDHLTAPRHDIGRKFCKKCLGSNYLKESELSLLRLRAVSVKSGRRENLTDEEHAYLMPRYLEAQTESKAQQAAVVLAACRRRVEDAYAKATMEYEGMKLLIENGINTDNVIYHSHVPEFRFGWRSPLSPSVAAAMRDKLEAIGFTPRFPVTFA